MSDARRAIHSILCGDDDRLVAVVGPCSIHDTDAALEYAALLKKTADALADDLCVVSGCTLKNPRTTVGWKGLMTDPDLNNTFKLIRG